MSGISALQAILPDVPAEVIREVLQQCGGDANRATEVLLDMGGSAPPAPAPTQPATSQGQYTVPRTSGPWGPQAVPSQQQTPQQPAQTQQRCGNRACAKLFTTKYRACAKLFTLPAGASMVMCPFCNSVNSLAQQQPGQQQHQAPAPQGAAQARPGDLARIQRESEAMAKMYESEQKMAEKKLQEDLKKAMKESAKTHKVEQKQQKKQEKQNAKQQKKAEKDQAGLLSVQSNKDKRHLQDKVTRRHMWDGLQNPLLLGQGKKIPGKDNVDSDDEPGPSSYQPPTL
eukprot:CAMPEP_0175096500 /NCGR_PEP_ID=MMETSP0086_2-20121207/4768_1 /TAXON_ID=136419 /ORGANISM="Unknown Unknown, Strain D1" /LENGTH=284 /DNA_ID=CAMNT_0016369911 /DNA_START=11 /DNA_END=865 /DNA_ORIENTATION=-